MQRRLPEEGDILKKTCVREVKSYVALSTRFFSCFKHEVREIACSLSTNEVIFVLNRVSFARYEARIIGDDRHVESA